MTLAWAMKATWMLGAALAAAWLGRRQTASLRFAGLAAVLALPAVDAAMPRWPAPTFATVVTTTITVAAAHADSAAEPTRDWVQFIWLTGMAAFLLRSVAGHVVVRLRTTPVVPMTVGIVRPRILLPREAAMWSEELRQSVMLHEQAHIDRRDPLWNLIAQGARAVYWFHPLAWIALRQLRAERERSCDDAVLRAGVKPPNYAAHLMACAQFARSSPGAGLPMASPSYLHSRVEAVLSPGAARGALSLVQRVCLAAGCCALLFPLAALGSPSISIRSSPMYRRLIVPLLAAASAAQSAELSGRIYDASNATVPGAEVVVHHRDSAAEFKAVTGGTGDYRLEALPGGSYDFEVLKPGFARYQRRGIRLGAASSTTISAVLRLGEVQETVEVTAPGQARPQPPRGPQRILVGGHVRPLRLIHHSKPVYPDAARAAGREGNVLLKAVIGIDGAIVNVAVLPGADADLAAAAEQAVRQWRYEPTLLNGTPVETVTTVEVNFRLGQA